MKRVLHVLSQRPLRTGSGITLDATVRLAAEHYVQEVVCGVPAYDPHPGVGDLPEAAIHPLRFGEGTLGFPVPGMSDVMPYTSTVFSSMSEDMLAAYRAAWRAHLAGVLERFRPDLIHGHHVWLLGSMLKDLAPDVPILTQSHATGLRQLRLCPHLAEEVVAGCRRNDAFLALHTDNARQVCDALSVPRERVHVVGAGYREEFFHARGRDPGPGTILYAGKLAEAKGLPWLIDAVERTDATLHVAGGGSGPEADHLRARLEASQRCVYHGSIPQTELADLMRRCQVFVLPSFFEGLPLVLVEALACGCRLVATALEAVIHDLEPALGEALTVVPLPRLEIDRPQAEDLPRFTDDLEAALRLALAAGPPPPIDTVERFGWSAVVGRIERVWTQLLG